MSVRLECAQLDEAGAVVLGTTMYWTVLADREGIEARLFLRQHGVRYTSPIRDWNSEGSFKLVPEALGAPGRYTLIAQWREPSGRSGWAERSFLAITGDSETTGDRAQGSDRIASLAADLLPTEVSLGRNLRFWVPSAWEAGFFAVNESAVLSRLLEHVPLGATAWDVGANLGLYSVALARKVGAQGRVVCFEANPVCVYFLRLNLTMNRLANCEVLPIALDDRDRQVPFVLNYGNSNLAVDLASPMCEGKPGHVVTVAGHAADALVGSEQVKPPNVAKIDVEGAEGAVLRGMRGTLARHRPTLLVELHGRDATAAACAVLDALDYTFEVVPGGRRFERARDLADAFPPHDIWQVLALPR